MAVGQGQGPRPKEKALTSVPQNRLLDPYGAWPWAGPERFTKPLAHILSRSFPPWLLLPVSPILYTFLSDSAVPSSYWPAELFYCQSVVYILLRLLPTLSFFTCP